MAVLRTWWQLALGKSDKDDGPTAHPANRSVCAALLPCMDPLVAIPLYITATTRHDLYLSLRWRWEDKVTTNKEERLGAVARRNRLFHQCWRYVTRAFGQLAKTI